jgi:hypothetical protein
MVEGEGFEPSKAEPADLQSAPFDREEVTTSLAFVARKLLSVLLEEIQEALGLPVMERLLGAGFGDSIAD